MCQSYTFGRAFHENNPFLSYFVYDMASKQTLKKKTCFLPKGMFQFPATSLLIII